MAMKTPVLKLLIAAVVMAGVTADARPLREANARPPSHEGDMRRPRDEDAVYGGRRSGQLRPLPEIEGMVLPRMGGARYIGPEMVDSEHYRLKFMRGSSVIWVDVDGRTGAIIGRTGE